MNLNIYNPYVREELYLMHHGILGQRWGKKNGPPYPLSAGAHSASEKKAGWRKSLADKRDEKKYIKKRTKELNKASDARSKAIREYTDVSLEGSKLLFGKKSWTDKDDLDRKLVDVANRQVLSKAKMEIAQRNVERILVDLADKGYTIKDKNTIKYENKGRHIVSNIFSTTAFGSMAIGAGGVITGNLPLMIGGIAGMTGGAIGSTAADGDNRRYVTKKYKVTRPGEKNNYPNQSVYTIDTSKNSRKKGNRSLSPSAQKSYNDAKNNDKWNMEFLEMYQPDNWNQNEALSEYKKFLKDPDEWIRKQ